MGSNTQPSAPTPRQLRKDAAENREKVLAAAVTAMLREGRNVPLASIAAEANVGVATLYRRYANRDALLDDLGVRAYGIIIDTLQGITEKHETGLRSVELFLDATIDHRSQLVLPFHGAPIRESERATALRLRVDSLLATLLERGRLDGTISQEVLPFDVIVFGALLAQPLSTVADWDAVAQRQKRLYLRGIAAAEE